MNPYEEWLFKSEHDLKSAQILSSGTDPVLDMAIYHTQQCAEKALKAYLVFQNQEIDKTYNLDLLNSKCIHFNPQFSEISEAAIYLRPFATLYRYPEGDLEPSKLKVDEAIVQATQIFNFVQLVISETSSISE